MRPTTDISIQDVTLNSDFILEEQLPTIPDKHSSAIPQHGSSDITYKKGTIAYTQLTHVANE